MQVYFKTKMSKKIYPVLPANARTYSRRTTVVVTLHLLYLMKAATMAMT